jgi:hypothetical protein
MGWVRGSWVLGWVALAACGSGDTPPAGDCGGNGPCPAGYTCDPRTRRCDAIGATGAPDAPVPDAPPTNLDARPPDAHPLDARPPDARRPDARLPDAPRPDAPLPDARLPDARPTAALGVTPTGHDFGAITLGDVSGSFGFTVKNGGGEPSGTIAAAADDPSFEVDSGSCAGAALAPGASCTVRVRFAPMGSAGPKQATLTILASPGGSVPVALTGTAIPLTPAALSMAPASQDLGSEFDNQSSTPFDFIVTNDGGETSGTISASSSSTNFQVTGGTCIGQPLAGGATCTVTVILDPMVDFTSTYPTPNQTVATAVSATLTVSATPGGSPTATVTGNALCQGYGVSCDATMSCCGSVPCVGGPPFSCHYP